MLAIWSIPMAANWLSINPTICAVVSAWIWLVVMLLSTPVLTLPMRCKFNELTWLARKPESCVVVSALTWLELKALICAPLSALS